MFKHEGPARSFRNNGALAAYLALTAGFVNACGFVLLGTFTSHVTGNVGRFGIELAHGEYAVAGAVVRLVLAFFFGALSASLVLESGATERRARAYGVALLLEGVVLALFVVTKGTAPVAMLSAASSVGTHAALLAFAMGLQNSLVTRLSGAVIRTTHLTGVVTDLGIETARWLLVFRPRASDHLKPNLPRILLLSTVALAFTLGAVAGTLAVVRWNALAMLVPVGMVLLASGFAFHQAREIDRRS